MAITINWKAKGAGSYTDISAYVDWQSVNCEMVITKERGTTTFNIKNTHWATVKPSVGDDVYLSDASGKIFGGTVTEIEMTQVKQTGGVLLEIVVTVTDYGYALDSKIVKTAYANEAPENILADLVNNYGPGGYDVTTYVQASGFLVNTISFNYQQLTKCIQSLATQIGWDWYVDPDKKIHFFYATTQTGSSEYDPAPITIDDTSGGIEWNTLDIDVNMSNMKNSVFVIGGTYEKNFVDSPLPNQNPPEYAVRDIYTTDGIRTVFPFAYRYTSSSITVFLNGVSISCGIDLQENPADYQCMYNTQGSFLLFPTAPASGQTLKVEGLAMVPIVAHISDRASIATYGEYQDAISNSQITSVAQAEARGQADITLYGHPVYDVKFNTLVTGLRVGQIIMLNSALYGVSNYPLFIKNITATGFTPSKLRYAIEAIGSDVVTFNDMMTSILLNQQNQTPVDSSTVLQVLLNIDEVLGIHDSVTITPPALPDVYGTAQFGFAKFT